MHRLSKDCEAILAAMREIGQPTTSHAIGELVPGVHLSTKMRELCGLGMVRKVYRTEGHNKVWVWELK